MIISKLGTGLPGQKYNTLDVDYVGRRYEDKVVFDRSILQFKIIGLHPRWMEGCFFKITSRVRGKIDHPSLYAYGVQGQGASIPANTI